MSSAVHSNCQAPAVSERGSTVKEPCSPPVLGGRHGITSLKGRPQSRRIRVAVPIAALALAVAGCGSATNPTAAPSSTASSAAGAPSSPASAVTVLATTNSKVGKAILVDANGRTLYLFDKDTNTTSTCSGSCASVWPPVVTSGKPQAGSGISAPMLATTTRSDGKTQVTYNGHPLYFYAPDASAGQTGGQGLNQFGALWYAVSPQGSATTSGGTSSGSSGGGSSGGGY